MMTDYDVMYMREAIKQAQMAYEEDEVPVGVVITYENRIIAKAHNQVELLKDPTAHAEILAITQAASYLKSKWLLDCKLYVTLEPCSMCAGALILARIKTIIFGAADPKSGACGSVMNISNHTSLNHRIECKSGILSDDCRALLSIFFRLKRQQSKEK